MGPAYLRHRGKNCSLLSWLRPRHLRIDLHHTNWGELKNFIHLFIYSFIWCVCVSMDPSRVAFACVSIRGQLVRIRSLLSLWGAGDSGPQAWKQAPLSRWPLGIIVSRYIATLFIFLFFSTDTKNSRRYLSHQNLTNSMCPNILILKKVRFDRCFPLCCACVPDAL